MMLLPDLASGRRSRALTAWTGAHFQRPGMMDCRLGAKAMREEEMLAEIEDFVEGFNQPT